VIFFKNRWFLPRDAMRKRCLCCHPVSICPFQISRHVRILYPQGERYHQIISWHGYHCHIILVFDILRRYQIPRAVPSAEGAKYKGEFAIFD